MAFPGRAGDARAVAGLVLAGLLLLFALQNTEQVSVVFLFWEMRLPRVVVLFVFFTGGFLFGYLLRRPRVGQDGG